MEVIGCWRHFCPLRLCACSGHISSSSAIIIEAEACRQRPELLFKHFCGHSPEVSPAMHETGGHVWSPQCFGWLECARCVYSWTQTLLGGLWNVHNFCDTCTTSVKRAQLLGNVHCTTSLKRAHIEYLKRLGGGGETRYTRMNIFHNMDQQGQNSKAHSKATRALRFPHMAGTSDYIQKIVLMMRRWRLCCSPTRDAHGLEGFLSARDSPGILCYRAL